MKRIALATCAHHPGFIANDDQPLLEELIVRGCNARLVRWDDPGVAWDGFDAVVLRTTWDYQDRLDAFLAWCELIERTSRLFNPLGVVEANVRKTYLRGLERDGVPIVPTRWIEPGRSEALPTLLEEAGWDDDEIILKPCVGAGASGMLRAHARETDQLVEHATRELRHGPVLVQRWMPTILDRGELSVVVIDGRISHAVRKVPKDGEFRVQIEFGGTYTPTKPTAREAEVALAAHAHAARAHNHAAPLLYARVDLVEPEPGEPAVIELEMIEPELFFPIVPHAAPRFADALLDRLG